jgi:hypothetical protein
VLLRSLLAIILTTKVCKAAILKELINRKLDPIFIGFYQHTYKEGPLGGLYYYSSHFSTLGLRCWAILLYIKLAITIHPNSSKKSSSIYLI